MCRESNESKPYVGRAVSFSHAARSESRTHTKFPGLILQTGLSVSGSYPLKIVNPKASQNWGVSLVTPISDDGKKLPGSLIG